ncbi:MAG: SAM-dependent methyltransferase [Desulfuromonas sp.]|mgnify:CR=1 FL=1|nr:MAG: SAM-dependent methyltransferase [Desulfuromonas sp.]
MGRIFSPFQLGRSFEILPQDESPIEEQRISLWMAQGAFGSGEHETTASCLEILEDLDEVRGAKVLDLGSGTGILAIAAIKLGALHATCIDIDPAAVKTCQHNCIINNVEDQVTHICGTLNEITAEDYDLILANIYGDILLDVASDLVSKARPGAPLLLSGILYEYNFDVRNCYLRKGCNIEKNRMLDEFSTVLLRRTAG